jgi:hypothetical protein
MPIQPIQLASSVPVQSEASPAQSRRVPPCGSHVFSVALTSVSSAAGNE